MIKLFNDDVLKIDFTQLPSINLVVCSPPYNVGIEYSDHADTLIYKDYLEWCEKWLRKMYNAMADDARICINLPFTINPEHLNKINSGEEYTHYPVVADYTKICQNVGLKYLTTIIWEKNISMKTCWGSWKSASAPFFRDPSEAILIFFKSKWKRLNKGISIIRGSEFMSWTKNIWQMTPETKSKHPAAFPFELPKRCIKLLSYKNDVVCDCFMGSGTTGDAAVRLGRNFIGVEKSTEYFQMAKERIDTAEIQTSLIKMIVPDGDEED
jgi:site-specific DNA-methyltransferase (adenine-specific)